MRGRFESKLLLSVCSMIWVSAAAFAEGRFYLVATQQWECVSNNLERYLHSSDNEIVFIAVELCPDIPQDPIRAVLTNSDPDFPVLHDLELDRLVTLSREALTCLAKQDVPDDTKVLRVRYEDCEVEAEEVHN